MPKPVVPADWLLAFIGADDYAAALNPVQVQKGVFLLQADAPLPPRQSYTFQPYSYGPCAFAIYDDLRWLESEGLIAGEPVPGRTWRAFKPTKLGRQRAAAFLASQSVTHVAELKRVREQVETKDFESLLRDVYARFPEFAERSVVSFAR